MITWLAHSERVDESVLVLAFGGLDVAAEPTVAIIAKVLSVALSVWMITLTYFPRPLFLGRGWRLLILFLQFVRLDTRICICCFESGISLDRCVRLGYGQLAIDDELSLLPFQPICFFGIGNDGLGDFKIFDTLLFLIVASNGRV